MLNGLGGWISRAPSVMTGIALDNPIPDNFQVVAESRIFPKTLAGCSATLRATQFFMLNM